MRTPAKFLVTFNQLTWFVNFHKKPVWLIATETDYVISVIKPNPKEVASGTVANFYNTDLVIIDTVIGEAK